MTALFVGLILALIGGWGIGYYRTEAGMYQWLIAPLAAVWGFFAMQLSINIFGL